MPSNYNTRNVQNFTTQLSRTNHHFNSFFPSCIRLWNNLTQSIKDSSSLSSFKTALSKHLNPPKIPSYYFIGTRRGQILHTRLRTRCSALKHHLYIRNLEPNPYCPCGQIESNSHYLLECPKYDDLRTTLTNAIDQPLTCQLLLFGDENESYQVNKQIFLCVQDFILKSKRFG